MDILKAKLVEKIKRTPTVESFRFLTEKKADFIPGQFLQVILDQANKDNKDLNKFLSFSSSPDKGYIEVTKRLSDSLFCQRLKELKIQDSVLLKLPLGSCVFKEGYQKICFLIGGIGITPVISILEYIIDRKLTTDAVVFYSNKTEEEIAFKKELDYWQKINNKIKVYYTVSECQPKDNTCIFGRIDKKLVVEKACDYEERVFFIFGPPKMVEAMNALSLEAGCVKENIKTENFIGY
jgi:ferredoxin-NADP reductase